MSAFIEGKNVSVEIFATDDYYPVLCATDMVFTRTPEFISKTGPTSGLFREFAVRIEEWNVSVSGLTKVENDASLSFFYMLQTSVRRSQQQIRIVFRDTESPENIISITGNILIGETSITGPATDFSQCSINFKGTGGFTQSAVIDAPPVAECEVEDTLWLVLAEGETSVHDDLLEQDDVVIIAVSRSGSVHTETTGTPGSLEFKSDLPNGDIHFDTTNPGNAGGEYVTVEYKIDTN